MRSLFPIFVGEKYAGVYTVVVDASGKLALKCVFLPVRDPNPPQF